MFVGPSVSWVDLCPTGVSKAATTAGILAAVHATVVIDDGEKWDNAELAGATVGIGS